MMEEEAPPPDPKPVKRVVPRATGNLPVNRVIKMGDVGLYEMTEAEIAKEGWSENLMMAEAKQIIGRRVKRPIHQGQPFLITDVFLEGDKNSIAPKPGYRAVTLSVPMTEGGNAEPGDTVDLYFTSIYRKPEEPGQLAIPTKTIKLVDSVEILDVWRPQLNALQQAVGYVQTHPSFTLQVKVDDAPKVTILRPFGAFSLYKRAPDDVAQTGEVAQGDTLEELLGITAPEPEYPTHGIVSTEYYRAGGYSRKDFPVRLPTPEQMAAFQAFREEMLKRQAAAQGQGQAPSADGQPAAGGAPAPSASGQPTPATGPRPTATSPPAVAPAPLPTESAAIESPFANETFTPPPATNPPPRATPQVPSPQVVPTTPSKTAPTDPFTDDGEILP
jgi:Flp pilus assembly protein CpaB